MIGTTISVKFGRWIIASIFAIVVVIIRRTMFVREEKKFEKTREKKRKANNSNINNSIEIKDVDFSRLQRKNRSYIRKVVKTIIDEEWTKLSEKYIELMMPFVNNINYNYDDVKKQFISEVSQKSIKSLIDKEPESEKKICKWKENLDKRIRLDSIGGTFLLLLAVCSNKTVNNEDISIARNYDLNVVVIFKRYYFKSMIEACKQISDIVLKELLCNYWYARINLEIGYNKAQIKELCEDGYITGSKMDALLNSKEEYEQKKDAYENKINDYYKNKSNQMEAFVNKGNDATNKLLDDMMDSIDLFAMEDHLKI